MLYDQFLYEIGGINMCIFVPNVETENNSEIESTIMKTSCSETCTKCKKQKK